MSFFFKPINVAYATQIVHWRYDVPYNVYNSVSDTSEIEKAIQSFLDPQNDYYCLIDAHGELAAFCCFGKDAQVPGGDYTNTALDIGLGVRPDLTGQGQGQRYIADVLNFAHSTFHSTIFRITVAAFNERALRAWKKAGFQQVQTFQARADRRLFVILIQVG